MDEIPAEIFEQAASDPASATSDGLTVQSRSVDDLIKLDEHLQKKAAVARSSRKSAWARVRMAQVVPPGTV